MIEEVAPIFMPRGAAAPSGHGHFVVKADVQPGSPAPKLGQDPSEPNRCSPRPGAIVCGMSRTSVRLGPAGQSPFGSEEGELRQRLRAMLPTLSPKRMRLARAILDEPFTVAVTTAADLGDQLGVDRATVVRFSRSLGYAGYSGLKVAIRS